MADGKIMKEDVCSQEQGVFCSGLLSITDGSPK